MKPISTRPQRTIGQAVEVRGIGFVTGKTVRLRFRPAPTDTGVVFVRTDLGPGATIPAHVDHVTGTHRRTTLGNAPVFVGLVEHVLAALAGLRLDNCYLDLDAPEPPGLDGSSLGFVEALNSAGLVHQAKPRTVWAVDQPVVVRVGQATLTLHPPENQEFRATYMLDYGLTSPIARQSYTAEVTPGTFLREIAPCRTFLLEEEALGMRQQGLGVNTSFSDLLVFGKQGVIGNSLRFANEPARHKVRDLMGDLMLLGHSLCGHVIAYRSGHPVNVELARLLSLEFQKKRIKRAA